jgi:hypothetical protein
MCLRIMCCSGPIRKISPKYNQAALFRTSDISWHGMPDPVTPIFFLYALMCVRFRTASTGDAQNFLDR